MEKIMDHILKSEEQMYAIIKVGNQQFRIEQNLEFLAQKTGNAVGSQFETKALLLADDSKVNVGSPELSNVNVKLEVMEDVKGPKVRGFKYKKRKNFHKGWGHRQPLQKLKVLSISSN